LYARDAGLGAITDAGVPAGEAGGNRVPSPGWAQQGGPV